MSPNASLTLAASSRKSGREGIRLLERGSVEIDAGRIATDQACTGEVSAAQVDAAQIAAHEHRTAQRCAVEVGALEVDVEQRRAGPVRARQRDRRVLVALEH